MRAQHDDCAVSACDRTKATVRARSVQALTGPSKNSALARCKRRFGEDHPRTRRRRRMVKGRQLMPSHAASALLKTPRSMKGVSSQPERIAKTRLWRCHAERVAAPGEGDDAGEGLRACSISGRGNLADPCRSVRPALGRHPPALRPSAPRAWFYCCRLSEKPELSCAFSEMLLAAFL